eukprot:TRINITY_DN5181_c0_g1_i4.p1 TRINITY_DN5181_c0_g1~~TRINITY_DN5181_c0_g1_i4.p1  ORF type:complete len:492 (+),score=38.31 TRINITY_DN5181_c0_g1_i4:1371-2846(+)
MEGTIPTEFGQLSSLTYLSVSAPLVNGDIPTELGQLSMISRAFLSTPSVTGSIPTELGQLSSMVTLYLMTGSTGTIPTEMGSLTSLNTLQLNLPMVNGTIPTDMKRLTSLISVLLNITQITGTIPTEFSQLTQLALLDIKQNNLTGECWPMKENIGACFVDVSFKCGCDARSCQVWSCYVPPNCVTPSTTSADKCVVCETGYFVNNDGICTECSECGDGQYKSIDCTETDDTQCEECSECGDGQYKSIDCTETDDTQCEDCSAANCDTCPENVCDKCSVGYYLEGGECFPCQNGGASYKCLDGYYKTGTVCRGDTNDTQTCAIDSLCVLYGCKTGICEDFPPNQRKCSCHQGDWIVGGPFFDGILLDGPTPFTGCSSDLEVDNVVEIAQNVLENSQNLLVLLNRRFPGISDTEVIRLIDTIKVRVTLLGTSRENIIMAIDDIAELWGAVEDVDSIRSHEYSINFRMEELGSSGLMVPSLLFVLVLVVAQIW